MATVATREAYFETGLQILSDLGYGGLKLAEVCRRLGVTTGSFYHYFENWSAYTHALIEHWVAESTQERVNQLRADPDPRRRIDAIIDVGLNLPHGAEAAIRVWSAIDPQVRTVQEDVDRERFEVLWDSAMELLHDERQAQLFANWAIYLLVGFEQSTLPRDTVGVAWIVDQLLAAMDSGGFSSVPPE